MDCVTCGSSKVTERPERTAQGYRRLRCRTCGKQYNERSGTALNHATKPSYTVSVAVDDPSAGGTPDATSASYTLNVGAVATAPGGTSVAVTEAAPWGSGNATYGAD